MIRLNKTNKPDVLVKHAQEWTTEYCEVLTNDIKSSKELATKYNNPNIKDALVEETNGKCAYCESKLRHITYGDIEHILPKNKDAKPELYVEWTNLKLACELCNRSGKGTYYDEELPLINPYIDSPTDFFIFLGPIASPNLFEDRAMITENHSCLIEAISLNKDKKESSRFYNLLYIWAKETNLTKKKVLEKQLHLEYALDKEYSAFVKAF